MTRILITGANGGIGSGTSSATSGPTLIDFHSGGGFAGGYVARLLGEHGATIVSPENFMLYTPMLPEAASGTLEYSM